MYLINTSYHYKIRVKALIKVLARILIIRLSEICKRKMNPLHLIKTLYHLSFLVERIIATDQNPLPPVRHKTTQYISMNDISNLWVFAELKFWKDAKVIFNSKGEIN